MGTLGWGLGWWLAACRREEPTSPVPTDAEADTDADTDTDADPDPPPAPVTYLRVVDVGPALGPVDLWIDGATRPLAAGVTGPDGSGFTTEAPGRRTLVITAAGGSPTLSPLARAEVDLAERARTTLIVFGTPEAPGLLAVPEVVADLAPDAVRYTFFAAAPALGPAQVTVAGGSVSAPYGERVLLGDQPVGVIDVAVDLDGAATCAFTVQAVAAGGIAALYLAEGAAGLTVFGHDPEGRFAAMGGPDPDCEPSGGSGGAAHDTAGGTGAGSGGSTAPPALPRRPGR